MLETIDLSRKLSRSRYQKVFPELQERLRRLQYQLKEAEIPTVIVFEGWDAAGKGTVIRHLTERLDPRAYRAHPGAPPSDLERRHHWLWRYQARLPEDGQVALFDHSWYGRVLVERVEKFVPKKAWRVAYEQIDQFERWLADDGQVIAKFFFHISKKEQRRRLEKIEQDPHQHWKVEKQDWKRNKQYDRWCQAIEEMLAKTDSPHAPWTIVEATDARWTRVKVFETLVRRMEEALARRQQAPAAVSRTQLAEQATRASRRQREQEEADLTRRAADEAGLPLEDEPALSSTVSEL